MTVPLRIARHVAGVFAGHFLVLLVAAVLMVAAVARALGALSLLPSPWVAFGPLGMLAAEWSARRIARRGEAVAIAAAGVSPTAATALAVLVVFAIQVVLGLPGTRVPDAVARTPEPQAFVGTAGDLVVVAGARGHRWRTGAPVPEPFDVPDAATLALPTDFVRQPPDPRRVRRQLFVVGAPAFPTPHPLDPTGVRWLWVVVTSWGVGVLLAGPRTARRLTAWAALPLVALAI